MKKTILILISALAMGIPSAAFAQYTTQSRFYHLEGDTIFERSPIYFYQWYWDEYLKSDSGLIHFPSALWYQYRYTSSPIHVIGIAACIEIGAPTTSAYNGILDTVQFLKLYDATPSGLTMMDSVCWSDDYDTHPIRWMAIPKRTPPSFSTSPSCDNWVDTVTYHPCREYYFDNGGFYVDDSFFVGTTDLHLAEFGAGQSIYINCFGDIFYSVNSEGVVVYDANCDYSPRYAVLALTNITQNTYPPQFRRDKYVGLSFVFPIIEIDTANTGYDEVRYSCQVPENLRCTDRENTAATIACDPGGNSHWELAYGPHGISIDDATVIESDTAVFSIGNLSADTVYDFYVRGWCTTMANWHGWSDWSHALVLGDTSTVSIANPGMSEGITIIPNPATDKVTVAAEGMESVELVAVDGATVLRRECRGECTIDLAGLANGTYMVRVVTAKGVAARKLVVQR